MPKHYHVVSGLSGGYLPNINYIYTSKEGAKDGAQFVLDGYREAGEKVVGGNGYWQCRESESLPGVLWDYVEITGPCFDDCQESE